MHNWEFLSYSYCRDFRFFLDEQVIFGYIVSLEIRNLEYKSQKWSVNLYFSICNYFSKVDGDNSVLTKEIHAG